MWKGEEQSRIEALAKQKKGNEVPEELCFILKEMQKNLMQFQCKEQKREALKLLDLENVHMLFDELIQRASKLSSFCTKRLNNFKFNFLKLYELKKNDYIRCKGKFQLNYELCYECN
ncbi:hypothetical protein HPP92_022505 [Vanilla planifolia]|uniref:Uncharacterized protein n=1 Tax=Vanilla planifolia TaxID=51239 RepID=A0A835PXL0_VANPL|nr:hypothetical protein HPP92_022505 [Vanilla planifolia]